MTKRLTLAVICVFISMNAYSGDPVWREGGSAQSYSIDVYHSPTCGCCKGWITHLEEHNFKVNSIEMHDVSPIKQKLLVPPQGASCHTALVNGLVVEGHVPAQDIKTLLAKADSDIRLLTVPGMPSGGPSMDQEGARKDKFKVYSINNHDEVKVYKVYDHY